MGRYLGPKVRILRRLKTPLLYGFTTPKTINPSPPGEPRARTVRTPSLYAIRLEEKQKLRFNYGISDKQVKKYIDLARRHSGPCGVTLLQLLEMRLDTTLFRLGFATTIPKARQWITHGHVFVNLFLVKSPSIQLHKGDIIHVNPLSINIIKKSKYNLLERLRLGCSKKDELPLTLSKGNALICLKTMKAYILRQILPREVLFKINDQLLSEYYA
jgi:ribosomal protein S4